MQSPTAKMLILCSLAVLLTACDQTPNEAGPGGVSREDARALDAAAEKLEAQPQLPVIPLPSVQEATGDKAKAAKKKASGIQTGL
jgi:hypothetical protein